MFDLEHAPLIAIAGAALMTGFWLLGLALGELFPVLRRFLVRSLLRFSLLRFSLIMVLIGAVVTIDRWHPIALAVLEIGGLLGVLGVLGLVLTQVIPSLRRRSGRWPPASM
jgi:hypothetical protein